MGNSNRMHFTLKEALATQKCLRISWLPPFLSGKPVFQWGSLSKPSPRLQQNISRHHQDSEEASKVHFIEHWLIYFRLTPKIYKKIWTLSLLTMEGFLKRCFAQAQTCTLFQRQTDPKVWSMGLVHTLESINREKIFFSYMQIYVYINIHVFLSC